MKVDIQEMAIRNIQRHTYVYQKNKQTDKKGGVYTSGTFSGLFTKAVQRALIMCKVQQS